MCRLPASMPLPSFIRALPPGRKARLLLFILAGAAAALAVIALRHGFPDGKAAGASAGAWRATARTAVPAALTASCIICLVGAAAAPWLSTLPRGRITSHVKPESAMPERGTLIFLLLVIAGAAIAVAPRLDHSLWLDEEFSMRHFIVGDYSARRDTDLWPAPLRWNPVTFSETLWDYRTPNNHGLSSFLARLAHGGPKNNQDPGRLHFVAWRLRLPSLLASLASLPAVWLLMRRLGFRSAALAAPLLMACHPWFIRYAAEARGYGLLFLLWPASCLCLVEAIRDGRWRWWLGTGLLMALMVWAWLNAAYWLAAFHIPVAAAAWQRQAGERRYLLLRWTASCMLAAAVALPLLLPGVLQSIAWARSDRAKSSLPALLMNAADAACTMVTGEPWRPADDSNPICHGRVMQTDEPWLLPMFLVPALLFGAGVWAWTRKRRIPWLLVLVAPPVVLIGHAAARSSLVMTWYLAPALPAFAMVVSAGCERIVRSLSIRGSHHSLVLCLTAAAGVAGLPEGARLRHHEIEQNLAAVTRTRTILNPRHSRTGTDAITVSPVQPRRGYDPHLVEATTPEALGTCAMAARDHGVPLFVHLGDIRFARLRHPDFMRLIEDQSLFRPVATLYGLDHAQTRHVWQWTGRRFPPNGTDAAELDTSRGPTLEASSTPSLRAVRDANAP